MPFLAAAAPYIALASTVVSGYSQTQAGEAAANNAKIEALQREKIANAEQASAQQMASSERKKARYLRSRAIAVAGASGAGVSDPTVSNILADIDTEGEMNALNTIWMGDNRAKAIRDGADALRREGRATRGAYYGQAASTVFNGVAGFASDNPSFFSKYGGDRARSTGSSDYPADWGG